MTKRFPALLLLIAAMTFVIVACGDDDDGGSSDSSNQEPVAEISELTGVSTAVTLDSGFVQALGDLGLTPAPVGDGEISNDGVASFPITEGNVTYYDPAKELRPFVQGTIVHDGSGLSLSAGKTTVELTDFVIDPGTSELTGTVTANGEEVASDALLFNLDGSTLKPLQVNEQKGTAVLAGTTVELSADAASLLNETFKVDALKEGFVIGISEITVALSSS